MRPVRSFVVRSGRLTTSQKKALDLYWCRYVVEFHGQALEAKTLFGNERPLVVEIGFGMGDSLLTMATQNRDSNFLGIEVHRPGIGKLLQGIHREGLDNLKIMCHDAREVIVHFAPGSLAQVQIFFPDPWPKKRHQKRRIVQAEMIELLAERLAPAGRLHLATDWLPYAEHMMAVLSAHPNLENLAGDGNYATATGRPETRFERRGLKLGHGVRDLTFVKPA